MTLTGNKILLGVTGGIAAYKAVFLLRLFKKAGADVKVIMTEAATEFITPLTFESLSENPVRTHIFEVEGKTAGTVSPIEHIDLAKWPDAVVIAPCTANTLANLAHGRADDLLSTIVSAYHGPIFLSPAMNDVMWENSGTQDNMRILSDRGYRVVPPARGDLACGYEATGRMAEPETIFKTVQDFFESPYRGMKVLVSAGGTEEDIDPVRVISNRSSGKMGFAVAEAARDLGADVTVVAARTSVPPPYGVRVIRVRTSADMSKALHEVYDRSDVLIMTAAVSDFRPVQPLEKKKKTADTWTLDLVKTEDVLQSLGDKKGGRVIVGFALETEDEELNALAKQQKKHCDMIVSNNPNVHGAGFSYDTNVVTIYNHTGRVYQSRGPESKRAIARTLLDLVAQEPAFAKLRTI
ncbi:MAG: bifunctional phosphopantothenoylcysteine decarboxylase/phosphopantothenate--cysteine ligase CoaBC [Candidatus Krumholzibacteria bacterium]|nr:bifunctional phosphopantothenoylcysteine decarboxylase/phosphopantothenate--cysteine ligase CoaBC [Candidatus Krumholzibacteria bacterium]MDH4338249.1 bifunctional phosphopantothenoylcysteine decarboxylase/phosphopantothenate--cysteine ligase CoaBC [Candidatus Krumholzibacteria bacterium]MDH5270542.1 bifunctional phosphopantothenoylcysteine decarboxylase/phosphopantothenate--cysteine ligase CoaBC [Candidatus Krumholzibacteria bacterium]MDH5628494.1 bifunctional phosphopantothenoylcysteine dec